MDVGRVVHRMQRGHEFYVWTGMSTPAAKLERVRERHGLLYSLPENSLAQLPMF
jgi:hypothetical protein